MLPLPTRRGFEFGWETGEFNKRTGRPIRDYFISKDREEVEAKQKEMQDKGYKVTEITECIF